jgi:glycosyltransferase involved in cell wall biosynthesis
VHILFLHQNFPAQFKFLAPALVRSGHKVRALVQKHHPAAALQGIEEIFYTLQRGSTPKVHPWLVNFESQTIRAEAVFRASLKMKDEGYRPDLIIAHAGWGESLFIKEVWPEAKLGIYCEYYYRLHGTDIGFDPEFSTTDAAEVCRVKLKNLNNILHFSIADVAISPTNWQASTFPEEFRRKITVAHEGIDSRKVAPNQAVTLNLKTQQGTIVLSRSDEVITFVNRNLEPYRGFHVFMRSLPEILRRRPRARVLIVGGNGVGYGGAPPKAGENWKEIFVREVRPQITDSDWARVHFLGNLPYMYFIPLLQVSTVHVYLTYPFVLSWSLIEAMSAGCAIVASNTGPLHEAIRHGETGRMVDFFDSKGLSDEVCALLDDPAERSRLGANARAFAVANYDMESVCLPKQLAWVEKLAAL